MLHGLFIASLIGTCIECIKEACEPTIPAENWANKKLYYEDMMNGVSSKERMKNLKNGKYKLDKKELEKYPEPHRDPVSGKIIIENCKLWRKDLKNNNPLQVKKWVEQGKYNLTPEELEKQHEEHKKRMEYLYSLL